MVTWAPCGWTSTGNPTPDVLTINSCSIWLSVTEHPDDYPDAAGEDYGDDDIGEMGEVGRSCDQLVANDPSFEWVDATYPVGCQQDILLFQIKWHSLEYYGFYWMLWYGLIRYINVDESEQRILKE